MVEPSAPYRIALINMPFAYLGMPSIALTQLAAALERRFGSAVQVDILYLHLDFAAYFNDTELYNHALSGTALMTGIGEWFFRHLAFPEAPDNAEAYYHRFYHADDPDTRALRRSLEEKRAGAGAFLEACFEQYDLAGYHLVGFTTLFSQTVPSMAMARYIKDRCPQVWTAIGGSACDEVMGTEIAEHIEAFDAVFSGPGLESFPDCVDALLRGAPEELPHIKGLFTRTNRPLPLAAGTEEPGRMPLGEDSDINEVLPLDYTGFLDKLEAVFPDGAIEPVLLFETSRGCWWAEKSVCTFCGLNGLQMKHRPMSTENARAYIEALYAYVPRCRIFMCVDTILPHGYPQEVFAGLTPPPEMTLFYEVRVDLSREDIDTLVASGVRAFQPGIEALSTASLKLMRKGTSAFRNLQFLKNCSSHPVRIDWNLLVFSPGEPESVYEKYLEEMPRLQHLAPPSGAYPISFARFSRYFNDPEAFGLDLKPQDFYGLIYPFDAGSVANLAYHFVDRNADTETIDTWLDRLGEAIHRWRERWAGSDGQPQAQLCFHPESEEPMVYDSRSGEVIETFIDQTDRRLLEQLAQPCHPSTLKDVSGDELTRRMQAFRERGWLFEENGRCLSLVT